MEGEGRAVAVQMVLRRRFKNILGPLPLTGAPLALSMGDPPYYPRHEPCQTREQCRRQRPLRSP